MDLAAAPETPLTAGPDGSFRFHARLRLHHGAGDVPQGRHGSEPRLPGVYEGATHRLQRPNSR